MILRLLNKHEISVDYIPEIIVKMRQGGLSNASIWNRLRANQEDSRAWQINDLYKPYFIRILKQLMKLKQFFKKPKNE